VSAEERRNLLTLAVALVALGMALWVTFLL
jgi:hypothetical protein